MMDRLRVNPSSEVPLFRQLAEQIKALVAAGHIKPDEALPSVRALAKNLGVNPMTISKAISQLTEEGWLTYRRGQPSKVAALPPLSTNEPSEWIRGALSDLIDRSRQLGLTKKQVQQLITEIWQEHEK